VTSLGIILSEQALSWFKEEMEAKPNDAIRFYARYGGSSPLHDGFSLGITKVEPDEAEIKTEHDGILFYMESRDIWFLSDHDLHVNLDTKLEELVYTYEKA